MKRRTLLGLVPAVWLAACQDKPADGAPAAAKGASPEQAYERAAGGHGFTVGALMAANTAYVFFDPTCPHCAQLWTNAQPLLGRLKMVWIPIALRPVTLPVGATLLAAPDPAAAMAQNEARVLQGQGTIPADPGVSDEARDKVKANTELFDGLGADSVPLIVFRNAKTGTHGVHPGAVGTDQLAAMVGL